MSRHKLRPYPQCPTYGQKAVDQAAFDGSNGMVSQIQASERDQRCSAPHARHSVEDRNGMAYSRVASSVSTPADTALPVAGQVIMTHPIGHLLCESNVTLGAPAECVQSNLLLNECVHPGRFQASCSAFESSQHLIGAGNGLVAKLRRRCAMHASHGRHTRY